MTINGFGRIIATYTEQTGIEMDYTFDSDIVSDLYKEAFGRRPSDIFWSEWIDATDAEKQGIWERLMRHAECAANEERVREQEAIVAFERHVINTILMGARDRETALRWIMDASVCNGDWEFLCYTHGLPYKYLNAPVSA